MFPSTRLFVSMAFGLAAVLLQSELVSATEWQVEKLTGEAWLAARDGSQRPLGAGAALEPGQRVQTGRNGRVLLVRGVESIQVLPNSVVGLPEQASEERTTIIQQAGSATLKVEKKGVEHFEVKTPYLAAVVKGTEFTVRLEGRRAAVSVADGRVDVTDYKSGQSVLVLPGQRASLTLGEGRGGLKVAGPGQIQPLRAGAAVMPEVQRVPVPRGGFHGPASEPPKDRPGERRGEIKSNKGQAATHLAASRGLAISNTIGAVRVDVHRLTRGMASSANVDVNGRLGSSRSQDQATIWQDATSDSHPGNGNGKANGLGSSVSVGAGNSNSNSNGNGVGDGHGAGNGNAYGAGNGRAYGPGNGNGPGGSNGHGHAHGHGRP